MIDKTEKLFKKLDTRFKSIIETDEFAKLFVETIKLGENQFYQTSKVAVKKFDRKFIDTLEGFFPHLDQVVRDPKRFIKTYHDVVDIEKAKKTDQSSVKHLAANSHLVRSFDQGVIQPKRIQTVMSEDEFGIYENRFIKTLIEKLFTFIEKRYQLIKEQMNVASERHFRVDSSIQTGPSKVKFALEIDMSDTISEDDIETENMILFERLEMLRQMVIAFRGSKFMENVKNAKPIVPPIMQTNIMLMEPNYKKCFELWQFIDTYESLGFSLEIEEKIENFSDEYINEIYNTILLAYATVKNNQRRVFKLDNYKALKERKRVSKPKVTKKFKYARNEFGEIIEVEEIAKLTDKQRAAMDKKVDKEKERIAAQKAKELEKARLAKEKEKEKEKLAKAKEREKAKLAAQKEKEKEKERIAKEKEREKAKLAAQKEKEREKAKLAAQKAKEKEQERLAKEKEAEKARLAKEKEAEIARLAKEKEAEKARLQKEKEAQKAKPKEVIVVDPTTGEQKVIVKKPAAPKKPPMTPEEKEKEKEKARLAKEKEKEKAKLAAQKAKEKEKERLAKEREKEKARLAKEKELLREKEKLAKQKEKEAEKLRLEKEKQEERVRLAKEKAEAKRLEKLHITEEKVKEETLKKPLETTQAETIDQIVETPPVKIENIIVESSDEVEQPTNDDMVVVENLIIEPSPTPIQEPIVEEVLETMEETEPEMVEEVLETSDAIQTAEEPLNQVEVVLPTMEEPNLVQTQKIEQAAPVTPIIEEKIFHEVDKSENEAVTFFAFDLGLDQPAPKSPSKQDTLKQKMKGEKAKEEVKSMKNYFFDDTPTTKPTQDTKPIFTDSTIPTKPIVQSKEPVNIYDILVEDDVEYVTDIEIEIPELPVEEKKLSRQELKILKLRQKLEKMLDKTQQK